MEKYVSDYEGKNVSYLSDRFANFLLEDEDERRRRMERNNTVQIPEKTYPPLKPGQRLATPADFGLEAESVDDDSVENTASQVTEPAKCAEKKVEIRSDIALIKLATIAIESGYKTEAEAKQFLINLSPGFATDKVFNTIFIDCFGIASNQKKNELK